MKDRCYGIGGVGNYRSRRRYHCSCLEPALVAPLVGADGRTLDGLRYAQVWAFVVGELPLGLALLLGGYLLWPSCLNGLMGKGIGAIALLIGLAGPVAFAGLTYDLLRNVLGSSPVPFAVTELSQLLLAAVAGLVPLLVMTVLAGGVAWKSLQRKEETEWKELQS